MSAKAPKSGRAGDRPVLEVVSPVSARALDLPALGEAFRVRRRLRSVLRLDARSGEALPAPGAAADDVALRDALRKLPPRLRAALVLHHMVGLSVAEAAAVMGSSPNTVKAQLRTGLARLRRELDDD